MYKRQYIISINEDSHTVLDSKTYNVASTIVYDESNPRSLSLIHISAP